MKLNSFIAKHPCWSVFCCNIILAIIIYAFNGISPFTDKSLLIIDLKEQYFPFYVDYYDLLLSGDWQNALYRWHYGFGNDFIGTFAYYLSSPFLLLLVLFPKAWLIEGVYLITLLKFGCLGASFCYLLEKQQTPHKAYSSLPFGIAYGFSGYTLFYSMHLMWLDILILLPLVILGVQRLIESKKMVFLIVGLTCSFICNFYLSFSLGLYVFLYFIAFLYWQDCSKKEWLSSFCLFVLSTLVSLLLSAFSWLPAVFHLLERGNELTLMSDLNFFTSPIKFFQKFFPFAFDDIASPAPYVYVGLPIFILVVTFFLQKHTLQTKKYQVGWGIIFLVCLCSFFYEPLNMVWHAFDSPNCFYHRFSYVFIFSMLFIVYLYFPILNLSLAKRITQVLFILLGLLTIGYGVSQLVVDTLQLHTYFLPLTFLNSSLSLVCLFLYFKCFTFNSTEKSWTFRFRLLWTVELVMNSIFVILTLGTVYEYATKSPLVELLKQDTNSYLQEERSYKSSYLLFNDYLLNQQKGIQEFNSLTYRTINQLLTAHHVSPITAISGLKPYLEDITPIDEALYSIRFLQSEETPLPQNSYTQLNETLWETKRYLPLGYPIQSDCSFKISNQPFENQEYWFECLSGVEGDYFINSEILSFELTNLKQETPSTHRLVPIESGKTMAFETQLQMNHSGHLYVLIPYFALNEEAQLWVNGQLWSDALSPFILKLPWFEEGEIVTLKWILDETTISVHHKFTIEDTLSFVQFNDDLFETALSHFQTAHFEMTQMEAGTLMANYQINEDKLWMITLPYDTRWKAYVDGEPQEVLAIGECFVGLNLPKGEHQLRLVYDDIYLKLSFWCSIGMASLLCLHIGCSMFYSHLKKGHS